MNRPMLCLLLCLPPAAIAAPWTFADPVTVAGDTGAPHYHHLDGAGRRHVAASREAVSLVWEDDRSGAPQVYVAVKPHASDDFPRQLQLSTGEEAYEPAVVALDQGSWLAAWEQDGGLAMRVIGKHDLGPVRHLVDRGGRQVTLASQGSDGVVAVWARQRGRGQVLESVDLRIDGLDVVTAAAPETVAPLDDHPFQGYPAAAFAAGGRLLVAWEDRRAGHTRLFHAWRGPGRRYAAERQLNEHNAPLEGGREVGLGSGVMRVTLATDGAGNARAIWLDKRNAASGYAVWGADSSDNGRSFGRNEIVQDELGATVAQWHAALAGGETGFVAAWDDAREGWGDSDETGDVLLSWNNGDGWSPDLVVPGASGEGYQGSPAVALDPHGDLHLVWIERDGLTDPTRLRYHHARAAGD